MKKNYSFIIPHHNAPDLLGRCLKSIPQREDIEIIVVDDNSDADKRPQVNRSDVKCLYIDAEHTKGAGHARNEGLKIASGKWLLFADSDDYYNSNFIEILDKYKESDIEVLYFNIDSINSETLKEGYRDKKLKKLISCYDGSNKTIDAIKYQIHAPWDKMIRHTFVERYHISFEEVLKGNDIQFSFLVGFFAKKIEVERVPLYVCTYNSTSLSFGKRSIESYLCSFSAHKKINSFFDYIGYPNWKINDNMDFLRIIKQRGLFFFLKFIKKYLKAKDLIEEESDLYVKLIKSRL